MPLLKAATIISSADHSSQVGCGVGNTALPLLEENPSAHVYACDFSRRAIDILKSRRHPRVTAAVADITACRPFIFLHDRTIDICTMVFVLSALQPSRMPQVCS